MLLPVGHYGRWRSGEGRQSATETTAGALRCGIKSGQRQPLPGVEVDHGKVEEGPAAAHAAGNQHHRRRAGGVAADANDAGSVVAAGAGGCAALRRHLPLSLTGKHVVGVQSEQPVAFVLIAACFKRMTRGVPKQRLGWKLAPDSRPPKSTRTLPCATREWP